MYYYTMNENPNESEYNYDATKGDLVIMNAVVIWPDFSGRRSMQAFHATTRSCNVIVNDELAQVLRENHINVKERATEDGNFYYIAAKLSYHTPEDEVRLGFKPTDPDVKLKRVQNGEVNMIHMTQDDVAELDSIKVQRCDLVLHHGKKLNQNGYFTLYISKMGSVYEVNDPFGGMYDDVPAAPVEEEEMPF